MRLTRLLIANEETNGPSANALLSLMCFQSSRFGARFNPEGQIILKDDQEDLISKGVYFLDQASRGDDISKFHLEARIAYWHAIKEDSPEKWEQILQLYNRLLLIEYSPIAALNRTNALAKANGKIEAIAEVEKIGLSGNQLYHSLLGELYSGIHYKKAIAHLQKL